jgi:hypothetical protein
VSPNAPARLRNSGSCSLNDYVVAVSARGHSRLPAGLSGTVYLVVSTSADALSDKNTYVQLLDSHRNVHTDVAPDSVAGPAIVELESAEHWEIKHGKHDKHGKKPCKKDEAKHH